MKWENERGGEVEDRRGMRPATVVGGGSIGLAVIALIGYFVFGIDPQQVMNMAAQTQGTPAEATGEARIGTPEDTEGRFVSVVHSSVNDIWAEIFKAEGKGYTPSKAVLYSDATSTACGTGQAAMGPFYCPGDSTVYLDLQFNQVLDKQLGAPGDFAKAYVIAHEVGHHVQNLLGTSGEVQSRSAHLSERGANALSVKLELQADCYAGVWAYHSNQEKHWLEPGDVDEALNAAAAVGDDTLQKNSTGRVVPDSFTHGSSAQRSHWFKRGFEGGDPAQCDTFAG
jgi:uncharacterized protein